MQWVNKAISMLKSDKWDCNTPVLFDGDYWNESIRDSAATSLLVALRVNRSAKAIILRNLLMHQGTENAMVEAFNKNTAVRSVSIRNVLQEGQNCPVSLPSTIFKNRSLREVSLDNSSIKEEACQEFSRLLRDDDCKLRSVVFRNVAYCEIGLSVLSSAISINQSLRYVTLRGTKDIRVDSLKLLLSSFSDNKSIKLLELEEMDLNEHHGPALATMLAKNQNIEVISLRQNLLNAKAIETIFRHGIANNTKLQALFLSGNPIGDVGAYHVVYGMQRNNTLQDLCLKNCGFNRNGCKAIARGIASFQGLRHLNMEMNKLDECAQDLLMSLERNSIIQSLLRDNPQKKFTNIRKQNEKAKWREIDLYLRLNRTNRNAIKDLHSMPLSFTANFLARPIICQEPNILYHFLESTSHMYSCHQ
jgi:hypothetical protein